MNRRDHMPTIGISEFVKRQTRESEFSHYNGSWEALATDVMIHFCEHVQGYRDGVVLVPLSYVGFFSGVVAVKQESKLASRFIQRRPEEEPFIETLATNAAYKLPAKSVEIVLYRKDVLLEHGDPATGADYDVISVNASPEFAPVPMDPVTMMRNFFCLTGGTKGEFTAEEFATSIRYWSKHARIAPAERGQS
jgi:hypothetical protein